MEGHLKAHLIENKEERTGDSSQFVSPRSDTRSVFCTIPREQGVTDHARPRPGNVTPP